MAKKNPKKAHINSVINKRRCPRCGKKKYLMGAYVNEDRLAYVYCRPECGWWGWLRYK